MAARIVLFGWQGLALDLDSTSAGALIASGMCRVSLTKWAGPLSDATVLMFRPEYLHAHGSTGESEEARNLRAMARARALVGGQTYELATPVSVGS